MEINFTLTLTDNSMVACVVGLSVIFLIVFGVKALRETK